MSQFKTLFLVGTPFKLLMEWSWNIYKTLSDNIDTLLKPDFRLVYASPLYENKCSVFSLSLKSSSESSEERFNLSKEKLSKKLWNYFGKFGPYPGNPDCHHGYPESHRGHNSYHPHHHPSSHENIVTLSSQAPGATTSAPPTVVPTTTTAAATKAASTVPASKTTGVASSTIAPSTLQPEGTIKAAVPGTALAEATDSTAENQQTELQTKANQDKQYFPKYFLTKWVTWKRV